MVKYALLEKEKFDSVSEELFDILANNMDKIAPTGKSREENYKAWYADVSPKVKNDEINIVVATDEGVGKIAAFFEFHTTADTLVMDEIQIGEDYHGKGVFRGIYAFVFEKIGTDYLYVEAAANKLNSNSIGVLHTLGLKPVGELHDGMCLLLRGDFADLMSWYKRK